MIIDETTNFVDKLAIYTEGTGLQFELEWEEYTGGITAKGLRAGIVSPHKIKNTAKENNLSQEVIAALEGKPTVEFNLDEFKLLECDVIE